MLGQRRRRWLTLKQHWINVSWLLGLTLSSLSTTTGVLIRFICQLLLSGYLEHNHRFKDQHLRMFGRKLNKYE